MRKVNASKDQKRDGSINTDDLSDEQQHHYFKCLSLARLDAEKAAQYYHSGVVPLEDAFALEQLWMREMGRHMNQIKQRTEVENKVILTSKKKRSDAKHGGRNSGKTRKEKSQDWRSKFLPFHRQYLKDHQKFDRKVPLTEVKSV